MTKEEFMKMRAEARARGELQVYKPVDNTCYLSPSDEKKLLEALRNQRSAIFKVAEIGLYHLKCVETYVGQEIDCQRKKIDELDNITVWRKTGK